MKPITREEMYLNKLTGEEQTLPEKPITREEQYFARLCGEETVIPDKPVTRREQYLATLCGEDVPTPTKAVTRIEQYMAFASGESEYKPETPVTREEMYWDKYKGGDVPEEKTIPYSDIITVTDALAKPIVDLKAQITAEQEMNGYEYPWVGGAGKNLLQNTATTQTINGVTFTVNADGTISLNGTATANTVFDIPDFQAVGGTAYILNGCPNGGSLNTYLLSIPGVGYDAGNGYNYNPATDATITVRITIFSGQNTNGLIFKPMIRLATESDATYTPYENICPITGYDEVNVTRAGKNLLNANAKDETKNGLTFTKIGNGSSFIVDGTTTANVALTVQTGVIAPQTFTAGTTVTLSGGHWANTNVAYIQAIYKGNTTGATISIVSASGARTYTFTEDATLQNIYINFISGNTFTNDLVQPQLERGSTDTEYEPYTANDTYTVSLTQAGTVYGGTLDVTTGELTVTHAIADMGELTWLYNPTYKYFMSELADKKHGTTNFITTNYKVVDKTNRTILNGEITGNRTSVDIYVKDERATTVADFITLVTGQKIVYELATPQTYNLTPTEINMLEGYNTVYADCGQVELTYLSKAAEKVKLMNATLQSNKAKLKAVKL